MGNACRKAQNSRNSRISSDSQNVRENIPEKSENFENCEQNSNPDVIVSAPTSPCCKQYLDIFREF